MPTFIELPIQLVKNSEDDDRLHDIGVEVEQETFQSNCLIQVEKIERINSVSDEEYKSVIWIDETSHYRCYLTKAQIWILLEDLGITVLPNKFPIKE